jgi:hypothetical protein
MSTRAKKNGKGISDFRFLSFGPVMALRDIHTPNESADQIP